MSGLAQMAWLEAQKYLRAYPRLACALAAAAVMAAALWAGAAAFEARGGLFEPFTVGVVDHDAAPELRLIFDFVDEFVVDLAYLDGPEALRQLEAGEIPAFVELPADFAADIMAGRNSPFTVHVQEHLPLQTAMVRLMAAGGVAFLSAAQAGVYATMDEAAAQDMDWAERRSLLFLPVNVAFAQQLMAFEERFQRVTLPLADGASLEMHLLRRFAAFWYLLMLLALMPSMGGYTSGMRGRFTLAGVSAWKLLAIQFVGLWAVLLMLAVPLAFGLGLGTALAFSAFGTAFGLWVREAFGKPAACGLCIFFVATLMYFASGGIVPLVFLPQTLWPLQQMSAVHWAAAGYAVRLWLAALVCGLAWAAAFHLNGPLSRRKGR